MTSPSQPLPVGKVLCDTSSLSCPKLGGGVGISTGLFTCTAHLGWVGGLHELLPSEQKTHIFLRWDTRPLPR